MYQDIIDELVLPFGADDVQGFATKDDAFVIELKSGDTFKAFDLTESLRKSEFVSICKMIADKLLSV